MGNEVAKAFEIRRSLEMMVQWVIPRLMGLDLEWYIEFTSMVAIRTRRGLPESGSIQDAMVGTVDTMRDLALASLDFQRACKRIFPGGVP